MESEQQIIRPTTGPSAIGDIGEKYACEYLKEEGVIVAALGSLINDAHAGHVEEYLISGKLWEHLSDEQIRFIFRPYYPKSYWKYYSNQSKFFRMPYQSMYRDYRDPDECLERIRQGHYEPKELIPFDRVSWDFVGWWANGNKGAFLFEVKTASPGKIPGTFRPERDMWKETGMEPFELRKLDRVGFIPYLVQVQLTDDDNPNISVDDIPIPEIRGV